MALEASASTNKQKCRCITVLCIRCLRVEFCLGYTEKNLCELWSLEKDTVYWWIKHCIIFQNCECTILPLISSSYFSVFHDSTSSSSLSVSNPGFREKEFSR